MKVTFKDFSTDVIAEMESIAMGVLEEVAGEIESQTKRNTAVKTGRTKNSWRHVVAKKGDEYKATIGSDYMNSVWEEFGTGEYALNGDGRKGGWFYEDEQGNGHFTHGKHPRRPFHKAYVFLRDKMIKYIQSKFKGGMQ